MLVQAKEKKAGEETLNIKPTGQEGLQADHHINRINDIPYILYLYILYFINISFIYCLYLLIIVLFFTINSLLFSILKKKICQIESLYLTFSL